MAAVQVINPHEFDSERALQMFEHGEVASPIDFARFLEELAEELPQFAQILLQLHSVQDTEKLCRAIRLLGMHLPNLIGPTAPILTPRELFNLLRRLNMTTELVESGLLPPTALLSYQEWLRYEASSEIRDARATSEKERLQNYFEAQEQRLETEQAKSLLRTIASSALFASNCDNYTEKEQATQSFLAQTVYFSMRARLEVLEPEVMPEAVLNRAMVAERQKAAEDVQRLQKRESTEDKTARAEAAAATVESATVTYKPYVAPEVEVEQSILEHGYQATVATIARAALTELQEEIILQLDQYDDAIDVVAELPEEDKKMAAYTIRLLLERDYQELKETREALEQLRTRSELEDVDEAEDDDDDETVLEEAVLARGEAAESAEAVSEVDALAAAIDEKIARMEEQRAALSHLAPTSSKPSALARGILGAGMQAAAPVLAPLARHVPLQQLRILSSNNVPKSAHEVKQAHLIDPETGEENPTLLFFKELDTKNPNAPVLAQLEAAFGDILRVILGNQAAKGRTVCKSEGSGTVEGVYSEGIPGFRDFKELFDGDRHVKVKKAKSLKAKWRKYQHNRHWLTSADNERGVLDESCELHDSHTEKYMSGSHSHMIARDYSFSLGRTLFSLLYGEDDDGHRGNMGLGVVGDLNDPSCRRKYQAALAGLTAIYHVIVGLNSEQLADYIEKKAQSLHLQEIVAHYQTIEAWNLTDISKLAEKKAMKESDEFRAAKEALAELEAQLIDAYELEGLEYKTAEKKAKKDKSYQEALRRVAELKQPFLDEYLQIKLNYQALIPEERRALWRSDIAAATSRHAEIVAALSAEYAAARESAEQYGVEQGINQAAEQELNDREKHPDIWTVVVKIDHDMGWYSKLIWALKGVRAEKDIHKKLGLAENRFPNNPTALAEDLFHFPQTKNSKGHYFWGRKPAFGRPGSKFTETETRAILQVKDTPEFQKGLYMQAVGAALLLSDRDKIYALLSEHLHDEDLKERLADAVTEKSAAYAEALLLLPNFYALFLSNVEEFRAFWKEEIRKQEAMGEGFISFATFNEKFNTFQKRVVDANNKLSELNARIFSDQDSYISEYKKVFGISSATDHLDGIAKEQWTKYKQNLWHRTIGNRSLGDLLNHANMRLKLSKSSKLLTTLAGFINVHRDDTEHVINKLATALAYIPPNYDRATRLLKSLGAPAALNQNDLQTICESEQIIRKSIGSIERLDAAWKIISEQLEQARELLETATLEHLGVLASLNVALETLTQLKAQLNENNSRLTALMQSMALFTSDMHWEKYEQIQALRDTLQAKAASIQTLFGEIEDYQPTLEAKLTSDVAAHDVIAMDDISTELERLTQRIEPLQQNWQAQKDAKRRAEAAARVHEETEAERAETATTLAMSEAPTVALSATTATTLRIPSDARSVRTASTLHMSDLDAQSDVTATTRRMSDLDAQSGVTATTRRMSEFDNESEAEDTVAMLDRLDVANLEDLEGFEYEDWGTTTDSTAHSTHGASEQFATVTANPTTDTLDIETETLPVSDSDFDTVAIPDDKRWLQTIDSEGSELRELCCEILGLDPTIATKDIIKEVSKKETRDRLLRDSAKMREIEISAMPSLENIDLDHDALSAEALILMLDTPPIQNPIAEKLSEFSLATDAIPEIIAKAHGFIRDMQELRNLFLNNKWARKKFPHHAELCAYLDQFLNHYRVNPQPFAAVLAAETKNEAIQKFNSIYSEFIGNSYLLTELVSNYEKYRQSIVNHENESTFIDPTTNKEFIFTGSGNITLTHTLIKPIQFLPRLERLLEAAHKVAPHSLGAEPLLPISVASELVTTNNVMQTYAAALKNIRLDNSAPEGFLAMALDPPRSREKNLVAIPVLLTRLMPNAFTLTKEIAPGKACYSLNVVPVFTAHNQRFYRALGLEFDSNGQVNAINLDIPVLRELYNETKDSKPQKAVLYLTILASELKEFSIENNESDKITTYISANSKFQPHWLDLIRSTIELAKYAANGQIRNKRKPELAAEMLSLARRQLTLAKQSQLYSDSQLVELAELFDTTLGTCKNRAASSRKGVLRRKRKANDIFWPNAAYEQVMFASVPAPVEPLAEYAGVDDSAPKPWVVQQQKAGQALLSTYEAAAGHRIEHKYFPNELEDPEEQEQAHLFYATDVLAETNTIINNFLRNMLILRNQMQRGWVQEKYPFAREIVDYLNTFLDTYKDADGKYNLRPFAAVFTAETKAEAFAIFNREWGKLVTNSYLLVPMVAKYDLYHPALTDSEGNKILIDPLTNEELIFEQRLAASSFLIMPAQTTCRYSLLINDLAKHAGTGTVDPTTTDAFTGIVNEVRRITEMQRLITADFATEVDPQHIQQFISAAGRKPAVAFKDILPTYLACVRPELCSVETVVAPGKYFDKITFSAEYTDQYREALGIELDVEGKVEAVNLDADQLIGLYQTKQMTDPQAACAWLTILAAQLQNFDATLKPNTPIIEQVNVGWGWLGCVEATLLLTEQLAEGVVCEQNKVQFAIDLLSLAQRQIEQINTVHLYERSQIAALVTQFNQVLGLCKTNLTPKHRRLSFHSAPKIAWPDELYANALDATYQASRLSVDDAEAGVAEADAGETTEEITDPFATTQSVREDATAEEDILADIALTSAVTQMPDSEREEQNHLLEALGSQTLRGFIASITPVGRPYFNAQVTLQDLNALTLLIINANIDNDQDRATIRENLARLITADLGEVDAARLTTIHQELSSMVTDMAGLHAVQNETRCSELLNPTLKQYAKERGIRPLRQFTGGARGGVDELLKAVNATILKETTPETMKYLLQRIGISVDPDTLDAINAENENLKRRMSPYIAVMASLTREPTGTERDTYVANLDNEDGRLTLKFLINYSGDPQDLSDDQARQLIRSAKQIAQNVSLSLGRHSSTFMGRGAASTAATHSFPDLMRTGGLTPAERRRIIREDEVDRPTPPSTLVM